MRTMLAHVAPRHCILVHGSSAATAALAAHLQQDLAGLLATVHTPRAGEAVELPGEPSHSLVLSNELMAGVRLHRIGDYKLGWVEGAVGPPAEGSEVSECGCCCCWHRGLAAVQPLWGHAMKCWLIECAVAMP